MNGFVRESVLLANMKTEIHRLDTPLGRFDIFASYETNDQETGSHPIKVVPFNPDLPNGMSVSGCYSAVLSLIAESKISNLRFTARLNAFGPTITAGPATGEALEAQSFSTSQFIALVGTEDFNYLSARLSKHIVLPKDPFIYTPESLSIQITEVPAAINLSLHFIVAWNSLPEPKDCSCWFAVDQPHEALLGR